MSKIPEWANWVARDKDGCLYAYSDKPTKGNVFSRWSTMGAHKFLETEDTNYFSSVKWEDKEPIQVGVPSVIENDPVNRPNHYIGVEGMEVREVQENFVPKYEKYGAMVMCDIKDAIKYITRAPDKNEVQDIDKAIRMLQYAKVKMTENIGKTEE